MSLVRRGNFIHSQYATAQLSLNCGREVKCMLFHSFCTRYGLKGSPSITLFHHQTRCTQGDARIFFCTYKTYLYAQHEISYEYIQILL